MLTMQLAQIAACLALCLALGALGGFIIAMHGRVAGASKDLAAILRMQEQIVATEKQHADELQQLQETMRTCCAKQDEVSDRLHQIKTVLEHFDRDLVALQRNPVDSRTHFAHRRALNEVVAQFQEAGPRDERKIPTWFTSAMAVPKVKEASSGANDSRADKTHWRTSLAPIAGSHAVAVGARTEPYVTPPSSSSSGDSGSHLSNRTKSKTPCPTTKSPTYEASTEISHDVNSTKQRLRERRSSRRRGEDGGRAYADHHQQTQTL